MKIKTKKQMNLPQLIEWLWSSKKSAYKVTSNMSGVVKLEPYGLITFSNGDFYPEETFTVEVETEIDEYTVFHTLVKVTEDGTVNTCTDATINREKNSAVVEIHAILNGVLKLIWTHEKGLVE